jgi:hypothetical protein
MVKYMMDNRTTTPKEEHCTFSDGKRHKGQAILTQVEW